MVGATALCIPDNAFASGYVLLCESKKEKIEKMFSIAEDFPKIEDELIKGISGTWMPIFPMGP